MGFLVGDVKLGGVDLNSSLQWTDRYSWSPVAQSVVRTLQGGLVVYSVGLTEGRPVTLVASEETGWFTYSMVEDLIALASSPSASYTLDFWGEIYTVRFDHSSPPAFAFQPLTPKDVTALDQDTDYFIGTLKLFTV